MTGCEHPRSQRLRDDSRATDGRASARGWKAIAGVRAGDRPTARASAPAVSLVVPARDERGNVGPLAEEVAHAFADLPHELILVDDVSSDGTLDEMLEAAASDPSVRVVRREGRPGKTAALLAGLARAQGRIVLFMDGDGQDDPADARRCVDALGTGVDVVQGWRANRVDGRLRRLSSWLGNAARSRRLGAAVRDATAMRAFRREHGTLIPPLEGMHRYLGDIFSHHGLRIVQVPVQQRPRRHGRPKFGVRNRLGVGLEDVRGVAWLLARWCPVTDREVTPAQRGSEATPHLATMARAESERAETSA